MEDLWELPDQSALTPANFTTLAHFSVSLAMNLPNSAGEPDNAVPPRSARRALKHDLHLSADQVGQCGRQAAIRHMDHIDFRHDLEQFGGHVGHGANAGRSEVDLARIRFGVSNKFGDCLGWKRRGYHQDMRATGDTSNRCDIAQKNKIELVVEC